MGPRVLRDSARAADQGSAMTAPCPPRPCPVCGSTARRAFFHQDFAAVDETTPVTSYDVVVCERCGAGFADGIPAQSAFDQPRSRPEVTRVVRSTNFITGPPATNTERSPRYIG